jgi:hypothetical protein
MPGPIPGTHKWDKKAIDAALDALSGLKTAIAPAPAFGEWWKRVELKGIHTTYKTLANGEVKKFHYACKGGPRIDARPGTAEFIRLYGEASSATRAAAAPSS